MELPIWLPILRHCSQTVLRNELEGTSQCNPLHDMTTDWFKDIVWFWRHSMIRQFLNQVGPKDPERLLQLVHRKRASISSMKSRRVSQRLYCIHIDFAITVIITCYVTIPGWMVSHKLFEQYLFWMELANSWSRCTPFRRHAQKHSESFLKWATTMPDF